MSATRVVLDLLGEIALLLWGIHMVHSGVLRAFGTQLRQILGTSFGSRPRAFLAGAAVTAVLQSSTAVALMTNSFVAAGMIRLVPALAVMLGANVGSTLIVQLLAFDITLVFPVLIFVGVLTFRRSHRSRTRDLGRASIGLGLILLALHLLVGSMAPVRDAPVLQQLLQELTRDPLLNIVIAAAFTWAAHSSVAAMLFVMSLATSGAVTPEASLAMVLGANLGSALNPVIAALGGDPANLRLPVANLGSRLLGLALVLPFLGDAMHLLARLDAAPDRIAANFHTFFNLALAALFILPLPWVAPLLERLLPQRVSENDPGAPRYLDDAALEVPSVALSNAAREALRMADTVEAMLRAAQDAFQSGDRDRVQEIRRIDDILDRQNAAIQRYLAAIPPALLDEDEEARVAEILSFAINLEHMGDVIDKSLLDMAVRKVKARITLPKDGMRQIMEMHQRLLDHLRLAVAVFMLGDARAARRLVAEKDVFRTIERTTTERHFARVQDGAPGAVEEDGMLLDIVRDLKRIDAHLAATAYPLLERHGELRSSRLIS